MRLLEQWRRKSIYPQPYIDKAPNAGFCFAYRVKALERMDLPRPAGERFPQLGWLRVDRRVASTWLRER